MTKKRAKNIMTRLYIILGDQLPLPIVNPSRQTANIKGFTDFGREMGFVKPKLRLIMYNFREGFYQQCEQLLTEIEEYLKQRRLEDV